MLDADIVQFGRDAGGSDNVGLLLESNVLEVRRGEETGTDDFVLRKRFTLDFEISMKSIFRPRKRVSTKAVVFSCCCCSCSNHLLSLRVGKGWCGCGRGL